MQIKLHTNWKQLGLYVLILVLASMLFVKCKNENLQLVTIEALKSENASYKLKNGQLVISAKTLFASNQKQAIELIGKTEAVKQLTDKFTKVKSITKYVNKIQIDTISVVYKDSIKCDFERIGELKTKEYSFDYKSNNKGFTVANFHIEDSLIHVTGIKKKWFWGRETNTIDISNFNKYISSEDVLHVEIQPKKRFYETTLFKVGIGVLAGTLITR